MQEPPDPNSRINDSRKTPAELHREKTYADRQARIREQAKRDEEAVVRAEAMKADRLAFEEAVAKANQAQAKADVYKNYCWNDLTPISSEIDPRCPYCGWYICSTCGSCSRTCDKTPFIPDLPDDLP